MRRITAFMIASALAFSTTGCFVVTHDHRKQQGVSRKDNRCKPSQHWEDGHCVHNGKGRGARKHDD